MTLLRDQRKREATLDVVDIDDSVHERLGARLVNQSGYLLFADVDPRSPVAAVGIQEGDSLMEFAGKPVGSVPELLSPQN